MISLSGEKSSRQSIPAVSTQIGKQSCVKMYYSMVCRMELKWSVADMKMSTNLAGYKKLGRKKWS